jgi:hypothetical protein
LQTRQFLSTQLWWFLNPSFRRVNLGLLLTSDSTSGTFPSLLFLLGERKTCTSSSAGIWDSSSNLQTGA